MHILLIRYDLHLPRVHSLKEKRSVVKKLLNEIRRDFNVSAAEVDYLDSWQRCGIAVIMLGGLKDSLERIDRDLELLLDKNPDVVASYVEREWL